MGFAIFCCAGKVPLRNLELSGGKEEQEWDLKKGVLLKSRELLDVKDSPGISSSVNVAAVSVHFKERQFCASAGLTCLER